MDGTLTSDAVSAGVYVSKLLEFARIRNKREVFNLGTTDPDPIINNSSNYLEVMQFAVRFRIQRIIRCY